MDEYRCWQSKPHKLIVSCGCRLVLYIGVDFGGNLLPKVKVESIVSDETYENIIDQIIEEINTGVYGDGKIFVYEVADAIRIRTGERGDEAL